MTNKEAIKILEGLAVPIHAEPAFDMAIEALKAQIATDTNVGSKDGDTIYRQDAILAVKTRDWLTEGAKEALTDRLEKLPSAQPEKRTEERAETHACDLIDRQAAIDVI